DERPGAARVAAARAVRRLRAGARRLAAGDRAALASARRIALADLPQRRVAVRRQPGTRYLYEVPGTCATRARANDAQPATPTRRACGITPSQLRQPRTHAQTPRRQGSQPGTRYLYEVPGTCTTRARANDAQPAAPTSARLRNHA